MGNKPVVENPWIITLYINSKNEEGFILTQETDIEYKVDKVSKKIDEELKRLFYKGLLGKYKIIPGARENQKMYRFVHIDSKEYLKTLEEMALTKK